MNRTTFSLYVCKQRVNKNKKKGCVAVSTIESYVMYPFFVLRLDCNENKKKLNCSMGLNNTKDYNTNFQKRPTCSTTYRDVHTDSIVRMRSYIVRTIEIRESPLAGGEGRRLHRRSPLSAVGGCHNKAVHNTGFAPSSSFRHYCIR